MFNKGIIEKKVLGIVREKIALKQKEYDESRELIDERAKIDVENIMNIASDEKVNLLDDCVQDIVGKFI